MHITTKETDSWVCLCGNTPPEDGFYPCNSEGEQVEPTVKAWSTGWYVCDRCGRIIRLDDLRVVGVRFNNTLTEKEIEAIFEASGETFMAVEWQSAIEQLFSDLAVRQTTKSLAANLMLDLPLTPAQATDFGVASGNHYAALRTMLRYPNSDASVYQIIGELDRAYRNGPALTVLVEKYAPRFRGITFRTAWDEILTKKGNSS